MLPIGETDDVGVETEVGIVDGIQLVSGHFPIVGQGGESNLVVVTDSGTSGNICPDEIGGVGHQPTHDNTVGQLVAIYVLACDSWIVKHSPT